ncbi:MAG TPA: tRNA (guanosine(46)-N7)-methyltransferase TrmB [Planctomycetota bacterium]|nr:tRNA (guanosine(46)-N7)-methyltransferase TrmB [Planctomycetota bacterium]
MKARPSLLHEYVWNPSLAERIPPDWATEFACPAPLAVEVGFGSGEYLAWWAESQPEWNFVGIELPQEGIQRASREFSLRNLENAKLVRGDARYLLRELFASASLEKVLMQFPMPWPKEKHAKHRVSSPQFAETLVDVLRPGGSFELVTDQDWYAHAAHDFLSGQEEFEVQPLEVNPPRPFRTRYEKKWMDEGRSFFRVLAQTNKSSPAKRLLLPEKMYHAHLPELPSKTSIQSLVGSRLQEGEMVGEIKEVLYGEGSWLLKVVSADESFTQFFFLRLVAREKGGALVKVEDYNRPYSTPSVSFLLNSVAEVLGRPKAHA